MQGAAHDSGFMVAGAQKADLLASLAAAIDRAQAEGTSLEAFRKDFRAAVAATGWTGWTGEGTAGGEAWRTRTIYVTNTKTAYHAGRLAQLRAGNYAYWVYRHNDSVRHPRPEHLSWDGITLPPDHPWWNTHYTPNGWGCECFIVGARSLAGARRLGGKPDKALPADWNSIDPATGAPPGIDEGWGYMPGGTVSDTVRAMAAKTQQWEYTLAKAYMQDVPDTQRDALATAYRELPSVADDVRRYAQRAIAAPQVPDAVAPYRTMGLLTSDQAAQVKAATGTDVGLFDFALDASTVLHVQDVHGDPATETPRGQVAVTAADYGLLPRILNAPDAIERDGSSNVGRGVMRFIKTIGGRRYVAAFEVRTKRKMLALQSLWIVGN
ncbi:MAG: phage head protein [Immundisolibacter sp.]|nr:phage head protein [Immundisolibacter sp.]